MYWKVPLEEQIPEGNLKPRLQADGVLIKIYNFQACLKKNRDKPCSLWLSHSSGKVLLKFIDENILKHEHVTIQQIIKQLSGEINPDDGPLPPIHKIKGKGYMWCYSPMKKTMVRVNRGNKVYILDDEPDEKNQLMAYTPNEIIFIDKKEIIELGYN